MAAATIPESTMLMDFTLRDADDEHRHPRIRLYFWAAEEETDEEERH